MTFPRRAAVFAAITVVPFLRFLVENHYSLFRTDSLAAAGLFLLSALFLATVARGIAFLPTLVICGVLVGTDSFHAQLRSFAPVNEAAAGLLLLAILGTAARALRDRFASILILFSASFFMAQCLQSLSVPAAQASTPPDRVLYLILDGHTGIAGFPTGIPACIAARESVLRTLNSHAFTTYTHATSNYSNTLLSIPSILNQQLLDAPDQFTNQHTAGGATIVSPNRLFAGFASRGYQVNVYQHRSIDYVTASPDVHRRVEYSSEIDGLEQVPGWSRRVLWLIGDYQGSGLLLSKVRALLPFRSGFRRTGPLAVRSIWPGPLASDIIGAQSKSLFFVHLLAPHEPYVYRADGTVRDPEQWAPDTPTPPLPAHLYQQRFSAYCEQVQAFSHQLDSFLNTLATAGVLDSITVVIHGDHGSRIRLDHGDFEDNLRNEFSALLAMRTPGARQPVTRDESASVLSLLARNFRGASDVPPAADVFWLDTAGVPHRTPLKEVWR